MMLNQVCNPTQHKREHGQLEGLVNFHWRASKTLECGQTSELFSLELEGGLLSAAIKVSPAS